MEDIKRGNKVGRERARMRIKKAEWKEVCLVQLFQVFYCKYEAQRRRNAARREKNLQKEMENEC